MAQAVIVPWYLVVANGMLRSAGKQAFEQEGKRYLGVGGVTWPLDDEPLGDSARILNRQLMDGRERIELSNGTWEALCLDVERAREYYLVAAEWAQQAQRYDQPDAAKASVRLLCLRERRNDPALRLRFRGLAGVVTAISNDFEQFLKELKKGG